MSVNVLIAFTGAALLGAVPSPLRTNAIFRQNAAVSMRLDFGQPEADESVVAASPLPDGWQEYTDPSSSIPYYVSPEGESTWDRPEPESVEPSAPPPPAVDVADPSTTTIAMAPPPPPAPIISRLAEAKSLATWIEAAGGSASGVRAAESVDVGVGLVAAQAAKRGDVLLSVPLRLGLSAESALRSSIGAQLSEFDPELADYAFIALAIIHERRLGSQSELAPWLSDSPSLLPAEGFADLPLLWDAADLTELEAATTAGVSRRTDAIRADFAWLQANVFASDPMTFPPAVFSLPAYTQAIAVALSRSVALADDDASDPRPVLLPLLDLANHDGERPTSRVLSQPAKAAGLFDSAARPECATLICSAPELEASSAATIRYGGSTSAELLLDFGFLSEPVASVAAVSCAINDEDNWIDEKTDVLEMAGLSACDAATSCLPFPSALMLASLIPASAHPLAPPLAVTEQTWLLEEPVAGEADEAVPLELLAFLRLKHLSAVDAFLLEPVFIDSLWVEHLQVASSPQLLSSPPLSFFFPPLLLTLSYPSYLHLQLPVSEDNERAALEELKGMVEAGLASLTDSVQLDLQTLAEADKASRAYALCAVRYAERRALQAASRTVAALLASLSGLEYYQARRLGALGLNPVETEEELDSLRAAGGERAAGRAYTASDYGDW